MDRSIFEFPENFFGFSFAEYLISFIVLIFALAVAEFFLSVGRIIRDWNKTIFYWEFYLWTIVLFNLFILTWFVNWVRLKYIVDGIFMFFLFTLPNLIIFLITTIYFPNLNGIGKIDLKDHFLSIRKKLFTLFCLYSILNILIDLIINNEKSIFGIMGAGIYLVFGLINLFVSSILFRSILVFVFFIQFIMMMIFL